MRPTGAVFEVAREERAIAVGRAVLQRWSSQDLPTLGQSLGGSTKQRLEAGPRQRLPFATASFRGVLFLQLGPRSELPCCFQRPHLALIGIVCELSGRKYKYRRQHRLKSIESIESIGWGRPFPSTHSITWDLIVSRVRVFSVLMLKCCAQNPEVLCHSRLCCHAIWRRLETRLRVYIGERNQTRCGSRPSKIHVAVFDWVFMALRKAANSAGWVKHCVHSCGHSSRKNPCCFCRGSLLLGDLSRAMMPFLSHFPKAKSAPWLLRIPCHLALPANLALRLRPHMFRQTSRVVQEGFNFSGTSQRPSDSATDF